MYVSFFMSFITCSSLLIIFYYLHFFTTCFLLFFILIIVSLVFQILLFFSIWYSLLVLFFKCVSWFMLQIFASSWLITFMCDEISFLDFWCFKSFINFKMKSILTFQKKPSVPVPTFFLILKELPILVQGF